MVIFPMPAYQNVVPDVTCADLAVSTSIRAGLINKLRKYEAENTKNGFTVTESNKIEPPPSPCFQGGCKSGPQAETSAVRVAFGIPTFANPCEEIYDIFL